MVERALAWGAQHVDSASAGLFIILILINNVLQDAAV